MNKTTKGAVAAAGAAMLLIGGAGSLAYWTAEQTVTGPGAINSGELTLSAPVCDGWVFDAGETAPGTPYDPATTPIVPGDVLTQSCTATVTATGEHMRATFAVTGATLDTDWGGTLSTGVNATIGGATVTEITEANNGETVAATLTVTFDGAADNTTQNLTANLSDLTLGLNQVHN